MNKALIRLSLWSSLFIAPVAVAKAVNSETVNSVRSQETTSSQLVNKFASYEACKNLGNSPTDCRQATDRGINFRGEAEQVADDIIQFELSKTEVILSETQLEVYRSCRALANTAKSCLNIAQVGKLSFPASLETERLLLSEGVKDCVRRQATMAGDSLGLKVSENLFRMQNLNSPNSFAFRAIQHYYTLCTEGT